MQAPFDIAADLDTPVSAFLKLAPLKPRFLLESVEGGERLARYSFLGFGDALEVRMDAEGLSIDGESRPRRFERDQSVPAGAFNVGERAFTGIAATNFAASSLVGLLGQWD